MIRIVSFARTVTTEQLQSLRHLLRTTPMDNECKDKIRVLSLNIWGLPDIVTKRVFNYSQLSRTTRVKNICNKLNEYDIVGLQEVWLKRDKKSLVSAGVKAGLKYSHFFGSGIIGSGLLVMSRWRISGIDFLKFKLNGYFMAALEGDYLAGKGVGHLVIRHPHDNIHLLCTHTIAQYYPHEQDANYHHRLSQLFEFSRKATTVAKSHPNSLVIALGDFNCMPYSDEFKLFMAVSNGILKDSWDINDSPGYTIFRDPWKERSAKDIRKRIDYIVFNPNFKWKHLKAEVVMRTQPQSKPYAVYSDHCGVSSTFIAQTLNSSDKYTDTVSMSTDSHDHSKTLEHVLSQMGDYSALQISRFGEYRKMLLGALLLLIMLVVLSFFKRLRGPLYAGYIAFILLVLVFMLKYVILFFESFKERHSVREIVAEINSELRV